MGGRLQPLVEQIGEATSQSSIQQPQGACTTLQDIQRQGYANESSHTSTGPDCMAPLMSYRAPLCILQEQESTIWKPDMPMLTYSVHVTRKRTTISINLLVENGCQFLCREGQFFRSSHMCLCDYVNAYSQLANT